MQTFLTAPNLSALPHINHGFWGHMPAKTEEIIHHNFANNAHCFYAKQYHSTKLITIDAHTDKALILKGDGLITNKPNHALSIFTADCAPLLMADTRTGRIANIHAGWRGALGGIIQNTLHTLQKQGTRLPDVHIAVGPHLHRDNFEVQSDFIVLLLQENTQNEQFLHLSGQKTYFDFSAYLYKCLSAYTLGSVHISAICTYAHQATYCSYRYACQHGNENKSKKARNLSAIMLARPC